MMAGLWGAKNSANRMRTADLGNALFNEEPRRYWDFDQALLRRVVWPEARKDALQHDAYSCGYKGRSGRVFRRPTEDGRKLHNSEFIKFNLPNLV